jgi:hypothetical protein
MKILLEDLDDRDAERMADVDHGRGERRDAVAGAAPDRTHAAGKKKIW